MAQTLTDLYRRVPRIACKGLCAESCGPVIVVEKEHTAMQRAAGGKVLSVDGEATCGYLVDGRCSVYDARPLICRLWGVVPEMPCPWGCEAERILSPVEAHVLMKTLQRIGGKVVFPLVIEV